MTAVGTIRVVAAVIRHRSGCVLLVRKRGTSAFVQPGGKLDAGEDDIAALSREITEELGCVLDPASVLPLGAFDALAANEPGFRVEATLYRVDVTGEISPGREIDEAIWIDPASPPDIHLAPLTRDYVLPLASRG